MSKTTNYFGRFRIGSGLAVSAAWVAGTLFGAGCATTPQPVANVPPVYHFTVLRYKPAVEVPAWTADIGEADDPEGAALNVLMAMQQRNLAQWLACWDDSERPHPDQEQQAALLRQWERVTGQFKILGRVVTGTETIVELAPQTALDDTGKIQVPLRKTNGLWCLTAMEPTSEYLHWENSTNKVVAFIEPDSTQKHMRSGKSKPKKS